jgi:hypothetical protein
MTADQDNDPIARAKADIAEFDRKINILLSEEARVEQQRLQMERERDRIRAFVEMYERYAGRGDGAAEASATETPPTEQETGRVRGRPRVRLGLRRPPKVDRKPEGLPPMPEMITTAIRVAGRGLEPREMTAFIRQKWWPNVKGESVSPIAWRMARQGQLKKDGSFYRLPS